MRVNIRFLRNLKLKNKIAVLCVALVLVSTGLTGLLFYRYAANAATEMANGDSSHLMAVESSYFDEKLKGLIARIFTMQTDQTFNDTVIHFMVSDKPQYRAAALTYFSNQFAELRYSEPFVSSGFLYTPKGSFYDLSLPIRSNRDFNHSPLYASIQKLPDKAVYWFPREQGDIYRDDGMVIPMVMRFQVQGADEDLYLVVNLSEQRILEYLNSVQYEKGKSAMIIDNDGGMVASNPSSEVRNLFASVGDWKGQLTASSGQRELAVKHDRYSITYQSMHVAPWKLIQIQSQRVILNKLDSMKIALAVILAVCVFSSVAVTFLMSATISKPLSVLEKTMQSVRRRNFDVQFEYPYEDEVGKLGRTFNFMIEEIHGLIYQLNGYILELKDEKEKVQVEQQLKRRAELIALQSQMKPHFLYNTLDSIKWLADRNGQADISRMIAAMASFFRVALSQGREIIRVSEELRHVESYLIIQKIRYGELIRYELDVDERLLSYTTVKFVLQPLVENAINHGIKQHESGGRIRITAAIRDGRLVFEVEDEGIGIHPLKLHLIRKRLQGNEQENESGFGLFNVNDRIKLYCGEEYGLKIESEAGKGTCVTASMPLMREEKVKANV